MEEPMKSTHAVRIPTLLVMAVALASCSSWNRLDRTEGTAAGAAGGAVAGAVVAGPVGAVVGGVGGAYVGHETTGSERPATSAPAAPNSSYDPSLVRSVQHALNERGYNAGAVDGRWGPATQDAVRRFQQVSGLPATGELERSTLAALGLPSRDDVVSSTGAVQ
jgi:murein L,D-transpeptidase YcbB/YkuD